MQNNRANQGYVRTPQHTCSTEQTMTYSPQHKLTPERKRQAPRYRRSSLQNNREGFVDQHFMVTINFKLRSSLELPICISRLSLSQEHHYSRRWYCKLAYIVSMFSIIEPHARVKNEWRGVSWTSHSKLLISLKGAFSGLRIPHFSNARVRPT